MAQLLVKLRHEPKLELRDFVPQFRVLQRSVSAYTWMKARVCASHPPLLITPTVSLELSRSSQFQRNDWSELYVVGIEEVFGLIFGKITDQTVRLVSELLGPAMSVAIASTPNMTTLN